MTSVAETVRRFHKLLAHFIRVRPFLWPPRHGQAHRSALQEIKSTTGLTWQQLARVFKVSQRSLHLWMDGEAMDSIHQERLYRVLITIRRLPFSEPFQNRAFLLSPQADGTPPSTFSLREKMMHLWPVQQVRPRVPLP